jgi:hypothetical protein
MPLLEDLYCAMAGVVRVPALRLAYDGGDIARALGPMILARGRCRDPVQIDRHLYAVTGGVGRGIDSGYMAVWAYVLVPIGDYAGELLTYKQKTDVRDPVLEVPVDGTGVLVTCPCGEYVLGPGVEIVSDASPRG